MPVFSGSSARPSLVKTDSQTGCVLTSNNEVAYEQCCEAWYQKQAASNTEQLTIANQDLSNEVQSLRKEIKSVQQVMDLSILLIIVMVITAVSLLLRKK